MMKTTTALVRPTAGRSSMLVKFVQSVIALFERIPHSLIALLGRLSIASIFWQSGQTKIQGLVIDLVGGEFQMGWPRLLDSALYLINFPVARSPAFFHVKTR